MNLMFAPHKIHLQINWDFSFSFQTIFFISISECPMLKIFFYSKNFLSMKKFFLLFHFIFFYKYEKLLLLSIMLSWEFLLSLLLLFKLPKKLIMKNLLISFMRMEFNFLGSWDHVNVWVYDSKMMLWCVVIKFDVRWMFFSFFSSTSARAS